MRTELGKITHVSFGFGGYQDAEIGISFTFGGASWGVSSFAGYWACKVTDHTEWTEQDRKTSLGETVMYIGDLLKKAKVLSVEKLRGIPVECTFDGNTLISFRILEEVL